MRTGSIRPEAPRPRAVGDGRGAVAVIGATLVLLAVAAAGTGVFRDFRDGSVDVASEWVRVGLGALVGLITGGAVVIGLHRAGIATRLVAGAGSAAVMLVLATTVALGATAGAATLHIGPVRQSAPTVAPVDSRPPTTQPTPDPIKLEPASSLPEWVILILAVIGVVVAMLGLFQIARALKMPTVRIRGLMRWRTGTAGEATEQDVDADLAADSFDESAAMLGEGIDPRQAIIAAYARLLERLGEAGCPRLAFEAPEEHLRRSLTVLGIAHDAMEIVVAKFLVARFSTHPLTEADRDAVRDALREAGRQLRELVAAEAAAEAMAEHSRTSGASR